MSEGCACGHAFLGEQQPKDGGTWVLLHTNVIWVIHFPPLTLSLYICEMEVMIPGGLLHRV